MPKLTEDIVSVRACEICYANGNDPTVDEYASVETYFNNMCALGETEYGAFDLEFEWGIDETSEGNCLFANIQAFGKAPMLSATFCPPHDDMDDVDTLLYMTVAPIVHGARGISFYALDMALQAGPAASGLSVPLYRAPNPLLNWGPARSSSENTDMVSDVHDVVKMLTGKKGGPDYLAALVDHTDYSLITSADNAYYSMDGGWLLCYDDYKCLNFIALEENSTGDILLLISKDYDDSFAEGIMFPGYQGGDYGPIQCWGGFFPYIDEGDHQAATLAPVPSETVSAAISGNPDRSVLVVSLTGMPAHSASLLYLPCSTDRGQEYQTVQNLTGEPLLERTTDGGYCIHLSEIEESTSVEVFDLTGRRVSEYQFNAGDRSPQTVSLQREDYISGMYFAVVKSEGDVIMTEKLTFF